MIGGRGVVAEGSEGRGSIGGAGGTLPRKIVLDFNSIDIDFIQTEMTITINYATYVVPKTKPEPKKLHLLGFQPDLCQARIHNGLHCFKEIGQIFIIINLPGVMKTGLANIL